MRFDQLPEGAREALAPWVEEADIQSVVRPDPTLYVVIEQHRSPNLYSMTTAFQLGIDGRWVVSADVQRGSAEAVLQYLALRSE